VTDGAVLGRIRGLAIPPAWRDVWICPAPNGHIQAVGIHDAGRRQYRYHDAWRVRRDREKFERVESFGRTLPVLRTAVERDLRGSELCRERVLAAIVRLLDVGCFRVGGEEYAEENDTFGVASLRKDHVRVRNGTMCFECPAKGSIERKVEVTDAAVSRVVTALRRRRGGGENLFVYKSGRRWVAVTSNDVNDYVKSAAGPEFSSKDFRTWTATVSAAASLARTDERDSRAGRQRAVVAAVTSVAAQLGNTPAVCRSSYVDPRVIDQFKNGETICDRLTEPAELPDPGRRATRGSARKRRLIEEAVIDLLGESDG
jgi:DNA topoisomerase I